MTVDRPWRIGLRTVALGYLAVLLIIPIGLIFFRTFEDGIGAVWESITTPAAISAFWLTITVTLIAVPLNTIFGVLCALALARGKFRGKWRLARRPAVPGHLRRPGDRARDDLHIRPVRRARGHARPARGGRRPGAGRVDARRQPLADVLADH